MNLESKAYFIAWLSYSFRFLLSAEAVWFTIFGAAATAVAEGFLDKTLPSKRLGLLSMIDKLFILFLIGDDNISMLSETTELRLWRMCAAVNESLLR